MSTRAIHPVNMPITQQLRFQSKKITSYIKSKPLETILGLLGLIITVIIIIYIIKLITGKERFVSGNPGSINSSLSDGSTVYLQASNGKYIGIKDLKVKLISGKNKNTKYYVSRVGRMYTFYNPLSQRYLLPDQDGVMKSGGQRLSNRREQDTVFSNIAIYNANGNNVALKANNIGLWLSSTGNGVKLVKNQSTPSDTNKESDFIFTIHSSA